MPNVLFPNAAILDEATGRIALYYGGADTCVCLAYGQLDEVLAFIRDNSA